MDKIRLFSPIAPQLRFVRPIKKSKSPKLKLGFYKKAAGNFVTIFANYNTNKFAYTDKAVSGFNQVKAALNKLGKKIKL